MYNKRMRNENNNRITHTKAVKLILFLLFISPLCFAIGCGKKGDKKYSSDDTVVSSENNTNSDIDNTVKPGYFEAAKLQREQTRTKNKETLMEIINNKHIAPTDKKFAIKKIAKLTEDAERENAAELMLEARGFKNAFVRIDTMSANVLVEANELSEQQITQIETIVMRKTGIDAMNIAITPIKVAEQ